MKSEQNGVASSIAAGELRISHLYYSFGDGARQGEVLRDISLDIAHGELFCLVGPSGCGKTTLLNLVAGFMTPSRGSVELDAQTVRGPGNDRVVVFQDVHNSLFPWMTVGDNVEFGLRMLRLSRKERRRRITHFLQLVGLSEHAMKFPDELSGGMKQRVQIARALATGPKVLLMDEPFAALDALTRRTMQAELLRIWGETKTTMLFITHDIFESVLLADEVGVMSQGPGATLLRVIQIDLPRPRLLGERGFAEYVSEIETLLSTGGSLGA